ncbi:MAG TPA: glycosyltransferase family 4 protein [Terriglobales bacterium]|nr:glycosyltransferase family 4 protein [Terriglobales bacterium]
MNNMKKILMVVGWPVQPAEKDDLKKYPADLLLQNQKYWFFRHWQEDNSEIDVMGYKKIPLLSKIEKKILHFHLFQSIRVLPKMKKYDLVIFFHSQIGLIPALFKSIFRIKTPLVLIDVEGLGRKNQWYVRPFIRKALQGIDRLFYLATVQKEDYQRYYPEVVSRSQFLPFGIDISRFSCNRVKEQDYIVSIGYLFRDWETLVKAYGHLRTKIKLLIVGTSKFGTADIKSEKIPPGIEFIGRTDLSVLTEITSRAKLVVLPLPERRHAFGQMTLLGCMAQGKAVIVSKVHGIKDYVSDGDNAILAEPGNWRDLVEKVEFLLSKPEQIKKIGRRARQTVERFYTEEAMSRNMQEGLQVVL